jgi:hypothetical protein
MHLPTWKYCVLPLLLLTFSHVNADEVTSQPIPPCQPSTIVSHLKQALIRSESASSQLSVPNPKESLGYYVRLPVTLAQAFVQNMNLIYEVFNITRFNPMKGGLISESHPWVTGISPETGKTIWQSNIIFRTPPSNMGFDADDEIVKKLGRYLSAMVKKSAATADHPQGLPEVDPKTGVTLRRMPHAVNYIHGSAHYNSGWLIFNDFKEAYGYFSNPAFRSELKRFVDQDNRELTVVFRNRDYDPQEYSYLAGFLRSVLPWYSNANGPKKAVHWGSAAPYATMNMITGKFLRDIKALQAGDTAAVVRPPIQTDKYFQGMTFEQRRFGPTLPERMLGDAITLRVNSRDPAKGNLFFVDQRVLSARKVRAAALASAPKSEAYAGGRLIKESFQGHEIEVHDLSPIVTRGFGGKNSGIVPLPDDFDPKTEIIYAIKNDSTGHTYLRVGDEEFHASVAFKKGARVTPGNEGKLGAWIFLRIKHLPAEVIEREKEEIRAMTGVRTLSCTVGVCKALDEGSGISLRQPPPLGPISPTQTLRSILLHGLVNASGERLPVEIYKTSDVSVEPVYDGLIKQDFKLAAVSPIAAIWGILLKMNPIFKNPVYFTH